LANRPKRLLATDLKIGGQGMSSQVGIQQDKDSLKDVAVLSSSRDRLTRSDLAKEGNDSLGTCLFPVMAYAESRRTLPRRQQMRTRMMTGVTIRPPIESLQKHSSKYLE